MSGATLHAMAHGIAKYEAFFGRPADFIRDPKPDSVPSVSVVRFPSLKAGFLRRIVTPVSDKFVYITHGMSSTAMQVPEAEARVYPARIELIAYSSGAYVGGNDGTDMIALHLQALAAMPFLNGIFFGPLQTASIEELICRDSKMSAFFFGIPNGVEMRRLCSCTPAAQLIVSVLPISASERAFIVNNGPESFLDLLEKNEVPDLFDPFRRPIA